MNAFSAQTLRQLTACRSQYLASFIRVSLDARPTLLQTIANTKFLSNPQHIGFTTTLLSSLQQGILLLLLLTISTVVY
jgi:hypothetical protein